MERYFRRFRALPAWVLLAQMMAKVVFGVWLGIFLTGYLQGYAWWLILVAVLLALPVHLKIFAIYRTLSTRIILLTMVSAILFGMGIGLLLTANLQTYAWFILAAALALGVPAAYSIVLSK